MSTLTRCNYCTLESISRRAHEAERQLYMEAKDGWITVYVDGEEVAAFATLTTRCEC